jgi:cytidylate kinase
MVLAIAIDGPAGVGKSTASKMIARSLGFKYIDTGAMYRAVALGAARAGVDFSDDGALERFCGAVKIEFDETGERIRLNGEDYTGLIRTQEAGDAASRASSRPPVRRALVAMQRRMAEAGRVVMEGRDIGTVVLPDAPVKFYMDARPDVRARRRHGELHGAGIEAVAKGMAERDMRDRTRADSPLKPADDAVVIDTSDLGLDEVVARMMKVVSERVS